MPHHYPVGQTAAFFGLLASLLVVLAVYTLAPQLPTWRRIVVGVALILAILLFVVAVVQL